MKTVKRELLNWIILLIPIIYIIINWEKFPAQVPIHFNISGEPDNYAPKNIGLIILPGINILTYFLLIVLPKIDPKKKNYTLFDSKYRIIITFLLLFICFITMITCLYSVGVKFNTAKVMIVTVTLLMLILGNYMGNIRPNYFIGIKVPWTLQNEEVWKLTHQFAGKLWVMSSVIMLALIFLLPDYSKIFLIYTAILVIVPIVYSYRKFKNIEHSNS